MKSYSLTAFFPRATKCVGTRKLVTWLLSCNRGLQGKIWPVEARKYPDTHPVIRRRGARVLSFTGDQTFLDSLQRFPKDYPFSVKISNVYNRGDERTSEGQTILRCRRPRMTTEALRNLLKRHGKEILEEEEAADAAKHGSDSNASASGSASARASASTRHGNRGIAGQSGQDKNNNRV